MIAENSHAYFTYEMLAKNQVLKHPFYPRKDEEVFQRGRKKFALPKQPGEVRIVSCEIAAEAGEKNDNSVYSCIRLLPESKEYKVSDATGDRIQVKQGYKRQLVYLEARNGAETTEQAIRINQLLLELKNSYLNYQR